MITLVLIAFLGVPSYTRQQIAEAQQEIRTEIPPKVKRAIYDSDTPAPRGSALIQEIRAREPALKAEIIQWERKMAYPLPGYVDEQWQESLFFQGDPETVQMFVDKYYGDGDRDFGLLHLSQNPDVIALIAPYMFNASAFDKIADGSEKHATAAYDLIELLQSCVELPSDIRNWASRVHASGIEPAKAVPLIQKWVAANTEALNNHAWSQLKPGEPPPPPVFITLADGTIVANADNSSKITSGVQKSEGPPNPANSASKTQRREWDSRTVIWLSLGALSAFGAVAFVMVAVKRMPRR